MTAEERYDLECQISALYDEAEYAEDHNNYWKANSLRQEADKLQKKLDADTGDTNECLSEDCDPFDVDWTDEKYAERRKQSKGVEEDYTGNPEERTDHLDYVDDNPTDNKFKFPKNITKKEDDHCKKSNPVVNHDPDDESILKEDWRDDVGLAPMWCCKNFKDLYEYMKKHGDTDAKDKTFAKLARDAVKQLKQKYGVTNQEAAEIIARGQALYKLLFENLNEAGLKNGRYVRDGFEMMCDLDKGRKKVNLKAIPDKNLLIYRNVCNTHNLNNALQQVEAEIARRGITEDLHKDMSLKEAHQPPVISGFVVDFCDGDFNWYEDFGESYAYVDVYPQKSGIGTDTAVTFIFSGPHGDWYDYDFSAHDYGYQFGQRAVELEISYFAPDYKNDELVRKVAKYSDYPENDIISDSDAMAILGVDQMTYDQLIIKAAQEAAEWFNSRAEEYVEDHASDLFDWDRW